MKLVIELTNGMKDSCGDCERVAEMIAGESPEELIRTYGRKMPIFYYED